MRYEVRGGALLCAAPFLDPWVMYMYLGACAVGLSLLLWVGMGVGV